MMLHDLTKSYLDDKVKLTLLYHSFHHMPYGGDTAKEIIPLTTEDFNLFLKAIINININVTAGLNMNEIKFLSIMCTTEVDPYFDKFGEVIGEIRYYYIDLKGWKSKRRELTLLTLIK
jgi:hypothetical protein